MKLIERDYSVQKRLEELQEAIKDGLSYEDELADEILDTFIRVIECESVVAVLQDLYSDAYKNSILENTQVNTPVKKGRKNGKIQTSSK